MAQQLLNHGHLLANIVMTSWISSLFSAGLKEFPKKPAFFSFRKTAKVQNIWGTFTSFYVFLVYNSSCENINIPPQQNYKANVLKFGDKTTFTLFTFYFAKKTIVNY